MALIILGTLVSGALGILVIIIVVVVVRKRKNKLREKRDKYEGKKVGNAANKSKDRKD